MKQGSFNTAFDRLPPPKNLILCQTPLLVVGSKANNVWGCALNTLMNLSFGVSLQFQAPPRTLFIVLGVPERGGSDSSRKQIKLVSASYIWKRNENVKFDVGYDVFHYNSLKVWSSSHGDRVKANCVNLIATHRTTLVLRIRCSLIK